VCLTTRVLIFDDDAAIGRLAVRVASASGMDAVAVTEATAFMERLSTFSPQVVLLDMQLGNTDGIEQLRRLADRHFDGLLVLMSGFDARVLGTARVLGQNLGLKIEAVLEKPLRIAQLEEVLQRVDYAGQAPSASRLLQGISNEELNLDFQPVISRKSKTLKKLEALVRWDHPLIGRISPDTFLPIAESDTAVIDAMTDWIISSAVEAYQILGQLGMTVPIAVNMSTQSLHDLTLPDRLERSLRDGNMPPQHLCLEITESAAFKDAAVTMDILSRMRLKGMPLSIDDFGIGYSSMRMLRQMPFTEIKIDRSFVADVTTSRDSRAIVKSIIDLAANMEMGCVAEGVETEETAALLEELGACDIQGFLIAHPMPIEAVPAWHASWLRSDIPTSRTDPGDLEPGAAAARGAGQNRSPSEPTGEARLSPRQLDVMQLLSEGCSVKEIARRLDLGMGTVKVHLSLAYSALGARNRIEAVVRAKSLLGARTRGC
jgi:EAL domain-containing protein (putative c-di-GMP-specific phosphodiesterase class I)/FixJ family two-component response regulator